MERRVQEFREQCRDLELPSLPPYPLRVHGGDRGRGCHVGDRVRHAGLALSLEQPVQLECQLSVLGDRLLVVEERLQEHLFPEHGERSRQREQAVRRRLVLPPDVETGVVFHELALGHNVADGVVGDLARQYLHGAGRRRQLRVLGEGLHHVEDGVRVEDDVAIYVGDIAPQRQVDAGVERVGLALLRDGHPGQVPAERLDLLLLEHAVAVVGGLVVHHEHLQLLVRIALPAQRGQAPPERVLPVVDRDDDRHHRVVVEREIAPPLVGAAHPPRPPQVGHRRRPVDEQRHEQPDGPEQQEGEERVRHVAGSSWSLRRTSFSVGRVMTNQ